MKKGIFLMELILWYTEKSSVVLKFRETSIQTLLNQYNTFLDFARISTKSTYIIVHVMIFNENGDCLFEERKKIKTR